MGKRSGDFSGGKHKKQKVGGFVDPNTRGVYATCNRGREQQCRKELMNLFSEKIEEYFDLAEGDEDEDEDERDGDEKKPLSVEEQIQKELDELKEAKTSKKELLKPIELGCECLVFIKTRKPVVPEILVERICAESASSGIKTTRFTQKLSPVTYSVSATLDELRKLAKLVLAPHFHKEVGQKPYKFAIQVSKRNFNSIPRGDMIKTIAECVGREHGHSVDLKQYDKLIVVECYKSNIGMGVVNDYLKLEKFNLQQLFEKNAVSDGVSRVKPKKAKGETEDAKTNPKDQKDDSEGANSGDDKTD
ncbi:uncharacterized protein CANTADRAFT_7167 [Suhomyces tanzawaensis NRRL Y-17324]|uniref:THUMP domain-containing protein n=1 Tax=Suhomyces tanzawaensis NRRL Y-17324 TaxID=984487 RepID=A0A1E4SH58_9ASCO|nr:uncharacterized protein CANTADRAFT_7167 [Suhomyces tanzawaensis NRRL Y-17324]ODV78843.1 hypothetical protein CANTADRAFT_7167 [Suhomyces tanzawaensis NRRL Y-17324]